ncbi:hypothetical protein, partial [Aureimonas sp. AU4]|uniref:hypothetical protein n=1 Tax=Aureimonas sp. AU4 TaxID=1638163 RepID=UPI000AA28E50
MIANTPVCDAAVTTDLGDAFTQHVSTYRGRPEFALSYPETKWLNVLRIRADNAHDAALGRMTDEMLNLLSNPVSAGDRFKPRFLELYGQARKHAYPLACALLDEIHAINDITRDYTLACFDFGMIRRMEDEALRSKSMRTFVDDMLKKLGATTNRPRHDVFRQVFDVYSEALVYRLLLERGAGHLSIEKIPESKEPGPDFKCELRTERSGKPKSLEFYIEVKALDIVAAPQRLPEMLDEGMDVQIELERQLREGEKIAIASGESAPYRPFGTNSDYDPWSVRKVIETLAEKAAQNFKPKQFQRGPTFALANLLRLPLPGQGASSLVPFFYDKQAGGACVSGVLWHMAFGEVGAPVHRSPSFEGAGTADGNLEQAGLLVDPAVHLDTPGLIALHYDKGAYRFDGLYDARWTDSRSGWSNIEVETVLHALCGDYNDRGNERAHEYAYYVDREKRP